MLELHIETAKDFASYAARCRTDAVPLKGIGNEARACSSDGEGDSFWLGVDHASEVGEQLVSRVRERAFLVRISTNDHSAERSELREKARKVAELVAGSLF